MSYHSIWACPNAGSNFLNFRYVRLRAEKLVHKNDVHADCIANDGVKNVSNLHKNTSGGRRDVKEKNLSDSVGFQLTRNPICDLLGDKI